MYDTYLPPDPISFKITIFIFYNTPVAGCPWFCYWYLNNNSLWWKRSFVLGVGGRHTIPGNTYTCFHSVWSLCIKYQWTRVQKQFYSMKYLSFYMSIYILDEFVNLSICVLFLTSITNNGQQLSRTLSLYLLH